MLEQQHPQTIKSDPTLLATLIWIFTSVLLGAGSSLYFFCFENCSDIWAGGFIALGAAAVSLPVLIVLCLALPQIIGSAATPVKKIKQLICMCYLCTLPYALLVSIFLDKESNINHTISYLLHVLAASAILFVCSTGALLLISKMLKPYLFASTDSDPASINNNTEIIEII